MVVPIKLFSYVCPRETLAQRKRKRKEFFIVILSMKISDVLSFL